MNGLSLPTVMLVSGLISCLVATFYVALSRNHLSPAATRCYRLLAIAYFTYAGRLACQLLTLAGQADLRLPSDLLYVVWVTALWLGIRAYDPARRSHPGLFATPVLMMLWVLAARAADLPFSLSTAPLHAAGASLFVLAGVYLWRLRREDHNWVPPVLAVLMWLHAGSTASYPFTRLTWYAPYGFTLFALFSAAIGMGLMVMALLEEQHALRNEMAARNDAEAALARSYTFLNTLLTHSPAGITAYEGETGNCVLANEAIAEMIGGPAAELRSHNFRDIKAWHESGLHELAEASLRDGQTRHREVVLHTRYGKTAALDCFLSRFLVGDRPHLLFTASDISKRKRAEEELRRHREHLEDLVRARTEALAAANQELEAFSYSVSHDLRAPLRAIDGFSALLTKRYEEILDPEAIRLLRIVRGNVTRMAQLIDDILAFSRTGRQELHHSHVDMESLARSAWQELEAMRAGREIRLELKPMPPARGDAAMLRQVWLNLLANAVKFTQTRTVCHIEAGGMKTIGKNLYYVKDDGVGFDPTYRHKLFGVFQRLHAIDEFEGTGIGLAIVKRVVTRHGGSVDAEARIGHGATFRFTLPMEGG